MRERLESLIEDLKQDKENNEKNRIHYRNDMEWGSYESSVGMSLVYTSIISQLEDILKEEQNEK